MCIFSVLQRVHAHRFKSSMKSPKQTNINPNNKPTPPEESNTFSGRHRQQVNKTVTLAATQTSCPNDRKQNVPNLFVIILQRA